MPKKRTLLKVFDGLCYDPDPLDVRPVDSPLLNDVRGEPKGGMSSPNGTEKYNTTSYGDQVMNFTQFRSRKGNFVISMIADGTLQT